MKVRLAVMSKEEFAKQTTSIESVEMPNIVLLHEVLQVVLWFER